MLPLLPAALVLLVALACSAELRARLGPGLALALASLASPLALTYVAILISGHFL